MTRLRWSWSAVLAVWLALVYKPAAMVKLCNVTEYTGGGALSAA